MILYFSGTGNSKLIASVLAEGTHQQLVSINELLKNRQRLFVKDAPSIAIVAPIYAGRIPNAVDAFIRNAAIPKGTKVYFVVTCGESMGNADRYAKKLCEGKSLVFCGMAEIKMPDGYIVLFTAPEDSAARALIEAGKARALALVPSLANGLPLADTKHGWSAMSHLLHPIFYRAVISAKGFRAGSDCIGCGGCVKACPLNNIRMEDGRPQWGRECTHCMACISTCPTGAIEYGKRTLGKKRYHLNNYEK
ncbi:MAG: EFR1 family ferrodoxin [Oscillospiraceae bacterium]